MTALDARARELLASCALLLTRATASVHLAARSLGMPAVRRVR